MCVKFIKNFLMRENVNVCLYFVKFYVFVFI